MDFEIYFKRPSSSKKEMRVSVPHTLQEPTFSDKWKAFCEGRKLEFLNYLELEELYRYVTFHGVRITLIGLDILLLDHKKFTLIDAYKFLSEYFKIDEYQPGKIYEDDYIKNDSCGKRCNTCKPM